MRRCPGGMAPHPHPQTLALVDDQGTTATAHVGQSTWGGGSWEATYTSDVPLSPDTRWIEVDGSRLELPERQPAPEVHLEDIEPMDPLRAVLYREILSTDRRQGGADTVEIASRALVATGALGEDDAMLAELRRIADAVDNVTPVPGLPEPWTSLLARFSKGDGRSGALPIGAVIDDLEGFSIRLDALFSEPASFSISLAMSPGTPLLRHFPGMGVEPSPITWWAEDDRMNVYVAFSDRGGGGGNLAEGQVTSLAPLDPKATELRLLPTGTRTRAVVTVPLDWSGRLPDDARRRSASFHRRSPASTARARDTPSAGTSGNLVALDHDDPEGERALAALGGTSCACLDVLGAWSRQRENPGLLTALSRGTQDQIQVEGFRMRTFVPLPGDSRHATCCGRPAVAAPTHGWVAVTGSDVGMTSRAVPAASWTLAPMQDQAMRTTLHCSPASATS